MARRILVTGGTGQIGLELRQVRWPAGIEVCFPSRAQLDLASPDSIATYMAQGGFACVINTAAWTAVDAAEDNVADCFLANALGPAWLAEQAHRMGAAMIHISTDYVFDGALDRPYREDDPVNPVSAYGASKLAGELAVRSANPRSVILRVAWVLSRHRANFLKTMLRLGAERSELGVVSDQRGCPTAAADIAAAIQTIGLSQLDDELSPSGLYHFVNAGEASWYELAQAIFAMAAERGFPAPVVNAITTAQFPTRAHRPANSRLDTAKLQRDFAIDPSPWRDGVQEIVSQMLADKPLQGGEA